MDDRRFDALARSLASGANRRQMLKGLLGLGGGAIAGATLHAADAARRPTPTPKPVTCPGQQHWDGSACVCPGGTTICGAECCPNGQAQCCDHACCYGECYGAELCCPSPSEYCAVTGECCPVGMICCPESGCISPDQCCAATDCEHQTCQAVECTGDHTCAYTFDCTVDDGCCIGEFCHRRDCQDDGSCSELVFDCNQHGNQGSCCEAGEVCLTDGSCCAPTCDGVPCGGSDGCGGVCGCPEGLSCLNGGCFRMFQSCVGVHACDSCGGCRCGTDLASGLTACMNSDTFAGTCESSADCPSGSTCSTYLSGGGDRRYLCVYPCCTAG